MTNREPLVGTLNREGCVIMGLLLQDRREVPLSFMGLPKQNLHAYTLLYYITRRLQLRDSLG